MTRKYLVLYTHPPHGWTNIQIIITLGGKLLPPARLSLIKLLNFTRNNKT